MYGTPGGGGGRVRQMFEQRRTGNERHGKGSPVGWDKSYPLDPVEAVNNEVRTPIYKQNVTRNNSYNKYSGNYGVRNGQSNTSSIAKRGMSLDRLNRGRQSQVSIVNISNGFGSKFERFHDQIVEPSLIKSFYRVFHEKLHF